jgi:hypothetical protein
VKTYFYMGTNPNNVSGVSWKIWRIERRGRVVTTWWGPAGLIARRAVPKSQLQSREKPCRSIAAARAHEESRIARKLAKGYERYPKRAGR